jgi:hypothetical protein
MTLYRPEAFEPLTDTEWSVEKAYWPMTDERWLDRARRFAMHALEQVRRLMAQRGRGRLLAVDRGSRCGPVRG